MNERRGPIIAAVVSALVALLALVFLLLPRISAVHKRSDDLDAAVAQEQNLQSQLDQLKEAKREAKIVQKQLNRLETKVPPTADLPSFIRLLQNAANASAVDFMSVSPGAPASTTPGISTIPTAINVLGSFFSVEEFLFKLETLPRACRVVAITVTPGGEGGQLALTMTGEIYTTDTSAGPGSVPGSTEPTPAAPVPTSGASPAATSAPSPAATTGG
ncbi:MAG TPA: type 4a pilus biogenesis protein PilO [Actinomycetota bacterium]|nr:type 4a pilus biogenesis protein PilO [Actinomycetota bacterium]